MMTPNLLPRKKKIIRRKSLYRPPDFRSIRTINILYIRFTSNPLTINTLQVNYKTFPSLTPPPLRFVYLHMPIYVFGCIQDFSRPPPPNLNCHKVIYEKKKINKNQDNLCVCMCDFSDFYFVIVTRTVSVSYSAYRQNKPVSRATICGDTSRPNAI